MLRSVAPGFGTPKPTVQISSSGAFGQITGYTYAIGYLITGCCLALLGQVATNMVSLRTRTNDDLWFPHCSSISLHSQAQN